MALLFYTCKLTKTQGSAQNNWKVLGSAYKEKREMTVSPLSLSSIYLKNLCTTLVGHPLFIGVTTDF